jgi:small secreted domain DUF320
MNKMGKVAFIVAAGGGLAFAGAGGAMANADSDAAAVGSPGVVSGNNIQVPIHIPINLCGNTIDIIGVLNPAFGNVCVNN